MPLQQYPSTLPLDTLTSSTLYQPVPEPAREKNMSTLSTLLPYIHNPIKDPNLKKIHRSRKMSTPAKTSASHDHLAPPEK
jgi:hypothetical protein